MKTYLVLKSSCLFYVLLYGILYISLHIFFRLMVSKVCDLVLMYALMETSKHFLDKNVCQNARNVNIHVNDRIKSVQHQTNAARDQSQSGLDCSKQAQSANHLKFTSFRIIYIFKAYHQTLWFALTPWTYNNTQHLLHRQNSNLHSWQSNVLGSCFILLLTLNCLLLDLFFLG